MKRIMMIKMNECRYVASWSNGSYDLKTECAVGAF